jgi:hypothetical protein
MKTKLTVLALLTLTRCVPSNAEILEKYNSETALVPKSSTCPAPATQVALSQIWQQAKSFAGCDVTAEAVYLAAANGCVVRLPVAPGDACFHVTPPNEYNAAAGANQASKMLKVSRADAATLFAAKTGTALLVRGTLAVDVDLGVLAFVASGVQVTSTK